jgi:GntR family transcriptional repressor for pyruvate dehydrogenase complex
VARPVPTLSQALGRPDGLAQRVGERILALISEGSLAPGDQLPAERTLAEQLGISRTVVREALRSLASMNVLEIRHGAGVFVGPLDLASLMQPLQFAVSIDHTALSQVAEARLVLEPGLAQLAAARADEPDIIRLRELVVEAAGLVNDPPGFLEVDLAFHSEVRRLANNSFLSRFMDSLEELARTSRTLTNPISNMREKTVRDLHQIAAAIARHDAVAAAEAMREHVQHVCDALKTSVST